MEEVKTSVSDLEKSLKVWVNERLTAYWTIEETKAALESQKDGLERRMSAQRDSLAALIVGNAGETGSLKAALEMAEKSIWNNSDSISALKADLEKAKTDIKDAYEKAIKDAVGEAEGRMSKKITAEVKTVNDRIDSVVEDVDKKMTALGKRVSDLEDGLKTLKENYERRIQSLTHIPRYSDGVEKYEVLMIGGEFKKCHSLILRFEVMPHSAAGSITKEQVSTNAVYTVTRASAGDIEPLTVKSVAADAGTGILTVVIDPTKLYKADTRNGLSSSVRIAVTDPSGLYDIASEYVAAKPTDDPGVLSYATNNNQKMDFPLLKVYDADGNESELIQEFTDGIWTIYAFGDATALDISISNGRNIINETLTGISINKPVSLRGAKEIFARCYQLTTAELGLMDIRNVTDMYGMFSDCKSLTSLDLSGWDTKNVTDMCNMFGGCGSLTSLDLSGWDTKNVTDMRNMFTVNYKLKTITMKDCDEETVNMIKEALSADFNFNGTIITE